MGRWQIGKGMRARCLLNICIPRCRWKNIQVPPPSRWFHLHYALSLLCLCLYFIDRAYDIFFLSFLFFSFISSCTSLCPRFLLLLFSLFTFFDSMSAVVARIWLVITTVSLDPHHRESLSAPFVRGVSSINTCRG